MNHLEPLPPAESSLLERLLASRQEWQSDVARRGGVGAAALSSITEPLGIGDVDDDLAYKAVQIATQQDRNDPVQISLKRHIDRIKFHGIVVNDSPGVNPFLADDTVRCIDPMPIVMADPKVRQFIDGRDLGPAHQELHSAWPVFVEMMKTGVLDGIERGYIPAEIAGRLESALRLTSIRIADTAIMETYGSFSASYQPEIDQIRVGHESHEDDVDYLDSLIHEFTHKLSGGTFTTPAAGSTDINRRRVGYSTQVGPELYNRPGLNEAMTHQITLGIRTGDFETVDPDMRDNDDKTYYGYRKILADFISKSRGVVTAAALSRGYFEDTDAEGNTAERRAVVRQIHSAYGPGALRKLDTIFEASNKCGRDQLAETILSRIHPPEIDERGTVTRIGSIDIDGIEAT